MTSATIVSFLLEKIQSLPGSLVYGLVAVLVFGEAALFIGFILPGETAVLIAGVVASRGHVNVVTLCIVVVVAAIIGDTVGYVVGARYGERLMTLPILRKRTVGIERALDGLRRRGPAYVFVGRFTAFLRAVMPGLAGMSHLHYRKFLAANAAGAVCWGVTYTLLGYYAGHALDKIEKYSGFVGVGVLVVVIAVIVGLYFLHRRREKRALTVPLEPDDDLPKSGE